MAEKGLKKDFSGEDMCDWPRHGAYFTQVVLVKASESLNFSGLLNIIDQRKEPN